MKKMSTRFSSSIVASLLAVSSVVSLNVSATESASDNLISFTTQEISSAITVDNVIIPAGSYAVTLNITNNAGFSASSYKLNLPDGYTPVKDGIKVVTEVENVLSDSLALGVSNESIVFISTAASTAINNDGDLLTFYVESDNTNNDLDITIEETNFFTRNNSSRVNNTRSGYYKIGDIDNDGYINAADANDILLYYDLASTGQLNLYHSQSEGFCGRIMYYPY